MRRTILIISMLITTLTAIAISPSPTQANEGRFLLTNQLGRDFRCLAFSVEVALSDYQILISCRGLVYPPQPPELDSYILWADGGNLTQPTKLANLQFGKASAKIKSRFTRLYVTLEKDSPKLPTGPIAMQGDIQPFNFDTTRGINLEPTPTVSPTPIPTTPPANTDETPDTTLEETPEATASARAPFWQSTFGKIIIIVTSGFLIFIVIVIIYSRRD